MYQANNADTFPFDSIILPEAAPAPLPFAAEELAKYLRLSLGVTLHIHRGHAKARSIFITTIALNADAEQKAGTFIAGQFDRSVAGIDNACLWLAGENPRSALYAVYDFLQEALDIRFFAPGIEHEVIPQHQNLPLPTEGTIMRTGSLFEFRDYWVGWGGNAESTVDFSVKNRINVIGLQHRKDHALDRSIVEETHKRGAFLRGPGHVWAMFLPEQNWFENCPELLPLFDGKRNYNGKTLCFSNPKARALFFDGMRTYLRTHSFWDIFAFWAEDIHLPNYCGCPACMEQNDAAWYLQLVNEAAAILEEELPHALFEFIGYHATRYPPSTTIPLYRNGERMFFDFCGGYSRNLYTPLAAGVGGSEDVYRMYRAWLEYLERINYRGKRFLMEYYNLCEGPNQGPRGRSLLWPMEIIREDTLAYHRDSIDGLGSWICFDRLCLPTPFNTWCWLRLYSDPKKKIADYADVFYQAYFGECGQAIRTYLESLTSILHEDTTEENVNDVLALAQRFDAIQKTTDDPVLAKKIAVVRAHYDYCVLLKQTFLAVRHKDSKKARDRCSTIDGFLDERKELLATEIDIPAVFWHVLRERITRFEDMEKAQCILGPMRHP